MEYINREGEGITVGQLRALVDAGLVPADTLVMFRRDWGLDDGCYVARAAALQDGRLLLTSSLPPGPMTAHEQELEKMLAQAGDLDHLEKGHKDSEA